MSGWPLSNEAGTRRCRIDVTGPTEDVEAVFVEFEEPSVEPVYIEDIALRKSIIPGEAQSSPQFSNPAPGNSLAAALWRQSYIRHTPYCADLRRRRRPHKSRVAATDSWRLCCANVDPLL